MYQTILQLMTWSQNEKLNYEYQSNGINCGALSRIAIPEPIKKIKFPTFVRPGIVLRILLIQRPQLGHRVRLIGVLNLSYILCFYTMLLFL